MTDEDFVFLLFYITKARVLIKVLPISYSLFLLHFMLCPPLFICSLFFFFFTFSSAQFHTRFKNSCVDTLQTYFCLFSLSHIHIFLIHFLLSNILTEFSLRLCTWKGYIYKAVCIGELVHLTKDYWLPFKSQSIHYVYL